MAQAKSKIWQVIISIATGLLFKALRTCLKLGLCLPGKNRKNEPSS
jgi:hypothetical protein